MSNNYGVRFVAAAAVIGFAAGASWKHLRAMSVIHGEPQPERYDRASQPAAPAPWPQLSPSAKRSTPTPTDAIEPFSPDVLKRRVLEVFPAGYLTIIAIIQGVALGAAIVATQQQLLNQQHTIDRFTIGAQAAAVFVAIVVITHRYLILTVNARWTPTIFDTLIPYTLGVGEITTAVVIGHNTTWWTAVSVLFLAAIGAFGHTYIRELRTPLYDEIRKPLLIRMAYCSVVFAYSIVAAVLSANDIHPSWLYVVLPSATIIGAIAVAINGERSQNKLYDVSGIPRWPSLLYLDHQQFEGLP